MHVKCLSFPFFCLFSIVILIIFTHLICDFHTWRNLEIGLIYAVVGITNLTQLWQWEPTCRYPLLRKLASKCFPPHLHLTTSKVMVIVWRLRGNIIRNVLYIAIVLPLQWVQLTKTVHTARLGLEFVFSCLSGWMIYLYVGVCFVLPWTVESLPFMLWRWRNKLKWAPFELFAPSSLLWFRSWLHPFKGHCEQKAMRDEGFIYVADHQLYWTGDVQDSQGVSVSLNANYKYF